VILYLDLDMIPNINTDFALRLERTITDRAKEWCKSVKVPCSTPEASCTYTQATHNDRRDLVVDGDADAVQ